MRFSEKIEVKNNVTIIARERGKKVPGLCRETHNTWVNFGRLYLAEVISPFDTGTGHDYARHYGESSVSRVVRYMGIGIGSADQLLDIATLYPTLNSHYPGQNTYTDSDITVNYLERPVKVTGTAGVGSSPGVWMSSLGYPLIFSGSPVHKVEYMTYFSETDLNLSGAYPSVPLSECALILSNEVASRLSDEVYDYGSSPDYIGAERQLVLAYNAFNTISKTLAVALELHWEISF
jgi:hypothetical protein